MQTQMSMKSEPVLPPQSNTSFRQRKFESPEDHMPFLQTPTDLIVDHPYQRMLQW
jgi:hypothetical protein